MSGEVWISSIIKVDASGECVRAILQSGDERIILCGSRKTLVSFLGMGNKALTEAHHAEVRPLKRKR